MRIYLTPQFFVPQPIKPQAIRASSTTMNSSSNSVLNTSSNSTSSTPNNKPTLVSSTPSKTRENSSPISQQPTGNFAAVAANSVCKPTTNSKSKIALSNLFTFEGIILIGVIFLANNTEIIPAPVISTASNPSVPLIINAQNSILHNPPVTQTVNQPMSLTNLTQKVASNNENICVSPESSISSRTSPLPSVENILLNNQHPQQQTMNGSTNMDEKVLVACY